MSAHNITQELYLGDTTQLDPGNAGSIVVTKSPVTIPLVSAGAETRTLARPTREGAIVTLYVRTYVGVITVTVTGGYDGDATTTFAFTAAKQAITFQSRYDGSNYYWMKISDRVVGAGGIAAGSALTVTRALHLGKKIFLNTLAGSVCTLPAATGSGDEYRFIVSVAPTSLAHKVQVVGNDVMYGLAFGLDGDGVPANAWGTAVDSDTISMDGSTQGGAIGDEIVVVDVAADSWAVRTFLTQSGTEATPFSAAV